MPRIRAIIVPVLIAVLLGLTLLPSAGPHGGAHRGTPPTAPPGSPTTAPIAARPAPLTNGEPYIASTIDLRNESLRSGSFIPGDGLLPFTPCYAPSSNLIYVTNVGTNYVTIVSAVTHALVGFLPVNTDGTVYCQVAGDHIYFAGANLHLIQVFNTTSQALIANITIPGSGVLSFGYNSVLNWVYASVITRPWSVTAISNVNFSFMAVQYVRNAPTPTLFDPVDNEVFVGDDSDNVNVLNATTLAYVANVTVGLSPQGGVWDPLNDRIYLGTQAPYNLDDLSEIDPVNLTVVANLTLAGWPNYTAISPSGQWIYFAMYPGDNITMINATNLSQQVTIPIGTAPDGITFDAATNEVVTANQATNNLTFVNATTGQVDFTVAEGVTPSGLAYDPLAGDLVVADASGNSALVWNTSRNQPVGTIPLPGGPTTTEYDPASGAVYVLQRHAGLVSEIDPATLAVVRSWPAAVAASSFVVDTAANQLFVANTANFSIDVERLSDGGRVASLAEVQPTALQFCPLTGLVYAIVGASDDEVVAVDPANDSVVATGGIGLIGAAIACDPFSGNVYVTNQRTSNVSVLNGSTLVGVGSLLNGGGGSGLAYDGQNAELVEASDNPPLVQTALIPGNLTVVGTLNSTVVATLPTGVDPDSAAYDPVENTFFVANEGSGTVSIVQPNTAPPRVASARLSPSILYYTVGTAFNVTASATSIYGIPCPPGVAYSWRVAPSSLATASGTNASTEGFVASSTPGTGSVTLNASFDGGWAIATAPLEVVGASTVPLASATVSPDTASLLVGGAQTFSASALLQTGGPAPPTSVYTWSLSPISLGSLNSTSGTVVNFTAGSVGPGTLSVSVYYAGSYAYASAEITDVAARPDVVARLVLTPIDPTVDTGGAVTFTALAYDAAGANISSLASYHWQLEVPAAGALAFAPGFQQSYTAGNRSGNDSLSVRATLNGATVWANTTILVQAPPPPPVKGSGGSGSLFGGVPTWGWVGLAAVIVVGVAVAVVLRRRRRPPAEPEPVVDPTREYLDTQGVDVSSAADEPPSA